jgi:hypothetical protein
MPQERSEGLNEDWVLDEIDGLDLLIPAPRRSPENIPVP